MLANFFGKSKPINFIVIIGIFFGFYSLALFTGVSFNKLSGAFVFKGVGIFLFFLIIFFFSNFIVTKNNLTFDNSYAFLFLILFISFFCPEFLEIKALVLFLLHLLFLRKVYSLQSTKSVFQKLFDAGFWLGILFIIEPFSIVFFIFLYGALYLHQKITIRTLLIPIIGFLIPLILFFSYVFWHDNLEEFLNLFSFYTNYKLSLYTKSKFLVPLSTISFITIVSLFIKTPKVLSIKNTFRKSWVLVTLNLLVSMFFIVLLPLRNGSELLFLLFPASIISANGLEVITKKVIKEIVLIVLLICSFTFSFLL